MLTQFEKLNGRLASIEENLRPLAAVAIYLMESGLLEKLNHHLPELITFLRNHFPREEAKFYLADVLHHLGISERSYYRKVAEGKLVPRKWEGPDFFYRSDLEEERKESKRRGRV